MRVNTLAATVGLAVLALCATACKSSSHAAGAAAASNPPATETQADSDNPNVSASTSASQASAAAASPTAPASASPSATASSAPAASAGGAINACSLLTGAQASALSGRAFGPGVASVLAPGQDQCEYPYNGAGVSLDVIVYEPSSGVTFAMSQSVLGGVGTVMSVSGVGDKAIFAGIELDVMAGKYLFAVQGAGGLNESAGAVAIAKQIAPELASK
ncbi:MAG TPA: hypothetical protein VGD55_07695 [Acidothermaceae bacterium]